MLPGRPVSSYFPRPGGWGEGWGLAGCPPWEVAQASDAGIGTSPIHLEAERETEAADCKGEDLELATDVDAPSRDPGEGASASLGLSFSVWKMGVAIPPSQDGGEVPRRSACACSLRQARCCC